MAERRRRHDARARRSKRSRPSKRASGPRGDPQRGRQDGGRRGQQGGKRPPIDPREELRRVAGGRAEKVQARLMEAAEAFEHERYQDARRILAPLRERHPDAVSILELHALSLYRLGRFSKAVEELERFAQVTGSTDQHPVLMDCYRAQQRYDDVEALWQELKDVSPSGALVTEGRIVRAGTLADQGRLDEALRLLQRGPVEPKKPKDHHLRLWYALADLEERAGNIPRARTLFEQVRRRDPTFADVAERVAALS